MPNPLLTSELNRGLSPEIPEVRVTFDTVDPDLLQRADQALAHQDDLTMNFLATKQHQLLLEDLLDQARRKLSAQATLLVRQEAQLQRKDRELMGLHRLVRCHLAGSLQSDVSGLAR